MQAECPITVACIQMEPKLGEKKANVAQSLDKIAEAAGKGAVSRGRERSLTVD